MFEVIRKKMVIATEVLYIVATYVAFLVATTRISKWAITNGISGPKIAQKYLQ